MQVTASTGDLFPRPPGRGHGVQNRLRQLQPGADDADADDHCEQDREEGDGLEHERGSGQWQDEQQPEASGQQGHPDRRGHDGPHQCSVQQPGIGAGGIEVGEGVGSVVDVGDLVDHCGHRDEHDRDAHDEQYPGEHIVEEVDIGSAHRRRVVLGGVEAELHQRHPRPADGRGERGHRESGHASPEPFGFVGDQAGRDEALRCGGPPTGQVSEPADEEPAEEVC